MKKVRIENKEGEDFVIFGTMGNANTVIQSAGICIKNHQSVNMGENVK